MAFSFQPYLNCHITTAKFQMHFSFHDIKLGMMSFFNWNFRTVMEHFND